MGYRFIGTEGLDYAGVSVASAGDIDGDGTNDLIIGAPNAGGGGYRSGEAYLISGADLAAADAADGATDGVIDLDFITDPDFDRADAGSYQFIGTQSRDYVGFSVSTAGDANNDGLADLLIGAHNADGGGSNSGEAYLISGADLAAADAADGVADGVIDLDFITDPDFDRTGAGSYQFVGTQAYDNLGFAAAAAGDVDNDGRTDLIIGAQFGDGGGSNSGEAYLIGGADLAAADAADGVIDGVIDLDFITDPDFDRTGAGSYQFIGTEGGDEAGYSVSGAGDVDNDGLADLIVGAYQADGGGSGSGEAYLIGGADLAAADAADGAADGVIDLDFITDPDFDRTDAGSYQFIGTEAGDAAGFDVSAAGDVDNDGLADLVIGAWHADGGGADSGEAYLISGADLAAADAADGAADGVIDLDFITDPDFDRANAGSYQFIGTEGGDWAGKAVASAGDVDGDGQGDLIIGAYGADSGGSGSGEAWLISGADLAAADAADGTADGVIGLDFITDPDFDCTGGGSYQFIGATAGDTAGYAVAAAGDIDNDGLADLIIGAYAADGGGGDSGGAYVVYGSELAAMDAADGTADGVIDLDHAAAPPVCFVAGTLIATPSGAVPVESLRPGDLVATWDQGAQPVRWVTHTTRSLADLVTNPKWRPVRIPVGALGHKQPVRDLYVSRQHRMLITGKKAIRRYGCAQKLLPAKDLIGWRGIELCPPRPVSYWHVALDPYAMLIANGTPTESFWPGPEALKTLTPAQQIALTAACAGLFTAAAQELAPA
jgi:hypothetical protein